MEGITGGREGTVVHTRSDAIERQAARARVMLPRLEESQARIALGLFRMLAEGQPLSHEQLAERLTAPKEEVSATLAALPAVFYNDDGWIVAFWGLGLGKSRHRVEVEGRTVYAWCFPRHPVLPADPGQNRTDRIDVPERREDLTRRSPGGHREPHPGGCRPHVRSAGGEAIRRQRHQQFLPLQLSPREEPRGGRAGRSARRWERHK